MNFLKSFSILSLLALLSTTASVIVPNYGTVYAGRAQIEAALNCEGIKAYRTNKKCTPHSKDKKCIASKAKLTELGCK